MNNINKKILINILQHKTIRKLFNILFKKTIYAICWLFYVVNDQNTPKGNYLPI